MALLRTERIHSVLELEFTMKNNSNTCGIMAVAFFVVVTALGLNETGELDGYKADLLSLLEILK